MSPAETITTPRLELVSMSVPFMEALARRDIDQAEREMGASVPPGMAHDLETFLNFRLAQMAADPSIGEWLGRAMVLTDRAGNRQVIGSIGFHGPPDGEGRLEVGYRVEATHRRRGYAREAIRSLLDWAYSARGIGRFIVSISPSNEPSLRLAEEFGFEQIGEQMDEIDGLELVFEASWPPQGRGTHRKQD